MNIFKQVLKINVWYLILMILLSQTWGYMNLLLIAHYKNQEIAFNEPLAVANMMFFYLIVSVTSTWAVIKLRSFNICMLPASPFRKYFVALGSVICVAVGCLLFSMAIEYIGSILTVDFPVDKQIEVGGYIGYIYKETRYFTLLFILIGINMILASLIKKKAVCYGCSLIIGYIFHLTIIHLERCVTSSAQHCIFGVSAIVLLTIGYQIYKRWQPANSGILMI